MHTPVLERAHPAGMGGSQRIYRFDNGYGASVIQFPYSYGGDIGLWEVGVLEWKGEDADDWHLTYDTPITDDVLGYLTCDQVTETLNAIAALAPVSAAEEKSA
jgi:hypothetical protein